MGLWPGITSGYVRDPPGMHAANPGTRARKGTGVLLTIFFPARRETVHTQPIGDNFESCGRHGLFDSVVFVWSPSLGVLQEMVHARQLNDSCLRVVLQSLPGGGEIFFRWRRYIQ